mgnify:CR=1 FL=1
MFLDLIMKLLFALYREMEFRLEVQEIYLTILLLIPQTLQFHPIHHILQVLPKIKIFFLFLLLNYYQNVTFKPPEIVRIGVYLSVEAVV